MEHKKSGVPIPTDNLIAYYPFSGNANDASGNGKHGTVYNATLTTDRNGSSNSAYSFNGTSAYISLPTSGFNTANPLTVSIWFKTTDTDAKLLSLRMDSGAASKIEIYLSTNILYLISSYSSGTLYFDALSDATIQNNNWHHLVCTINYTTKIGYIYFDGILRIENYQSTLINATTPTYNYLGKNGIGNIQYFSGLLDDARFYSRALTQDEITALYNE